MSVHVAKRAIYDVYMQLLARRNLYHLRDARAFRLRLDRTLSRAATIWPTVLPLSPKSVLDVGAHTGEIAKELAAVYHPDIHFGLVEPQADLALRLHDLRLASLQRVFACALGRIESSAPLNVLAFAPSSSLMQVAPGIDKYFQHSMEIIKTSIVPVRTLDSIFNECNLNELDLLKVDVQGYELEVLAGGSHMLRQTRSVVCEVSFFEHYLEQPLFPEIYQFMIDNNYAMHGTFGYSYDESGRPLQCDVVFRNLARL